MPDAPTPSTTGSSAPKWSARLKALRRVPSLLRLVWSTHRGYTVAIVIVRSIRALSPVAMLWIGKLIIDSVVQFTNGTRRPEDAGGLWVLVGIECAIVVGSELLGRLSVALETLLSELFGNAMSIRIMRHASRLDLAQFEDPTFYDRLERARQQATARLGLLVQMLELMQDALTLTSLATALVAFEPWLLVVLTVAVLPTLIVETHLASLGYALLFRWTPQRRELDYLRFIGASNLAAKEVKLFDLGDWLVGRHRSIADRYYQDNKRLIVRRGALGVILSAAVTVAYYGAYVLIVMRTIRGALSLGTLTFLAGSFARARDLLRRMIGVISSVAEQALYLEDLFTFLEMEPSILSPPNARHVGPRITRGFILEDVGFRYPGSTKWALRNLNLTLKAGESVALVGENGAGKTTVVKLLTRLYDPSEGRILLDGVDLREHDIDSLHSAIGVIFQDFVKYEMRVRENIAVGRIESLVEGGAARNGSAVRRAAERSLAVDVINRMPHGYDQMLGRRFAGGLDLSGGEWQKFALARAYLRDAQVLILDEPTASLDARAEYQVFERFADLMRDRLVVLISHRFSTTRMADRVVVIRDGAVVEDGSHDELVRTKGLYSELFAMQAVGYR